MYFEVLFFRTVCSILPKDKARIGQFTKCDKSEIFAEKAIKTGINENNNKRKAMMILRSRLVFIIISQKYVACKAGGWKYTIDSASMRVNRLIMSHFNC